MSTRTLWMVVAAVLLLSGEWALAQPRDYASFLREIRDLDHLPYLEDGVVSRQFSSYHRASRYDREAKQCVEMETNGDAGHKLSVHFGPQAGVELQAFDLPPATPRFAFGDLQWVLDPVERNHVFFLPGNGATEAKTTPPENLVATIPGPGCVYRI